MEYEKNVFYHPEAWGLEIVFNLELGASYEFDTFLIFKKLDDDSLWYVQDSGCSCPTPFENVNSFDDLNKIDKQSLHTFESDFENYASREYRPLDKTKKLEVLQTIRKMVN